MPEERELMKRQPPKPDRPYKPAPRPGERRQNRIYSVTLTGIFVNIVLSAGKLIASILGRSGAMLADAIHSMSDFATDIIVLLSMNGTPEKREEERRHRYDRYETLATVVIGIIFSCVAIIILVNSARSIDSILTGTRPPRPGLIAVIAAAVSIVAKEWLYRYTLRVGNKLKNRAVITNALHHRSDAYSSVATLIGIGAARFIGGPWIILEPIAAIVVAALIIKVSIELIMPSLSELFERSLPALEEQRILEMVSSIHGVNDPHRLHTRSLGSRVSIELHIRLNHDMTIDASHQVVVDIEELLRREYGPETLVTVHVEPLAPIGWQ